MKVFINNFDSKKFKSFLHKNKSKSLILFILCISLLSFNNCTSKNTPNIIFIFADDWGYGDLGCHGSTFIKTPNLDRMAAEGIDFQNFSVSNPVCSPSRTAILTGQFPARHSVHGHFASVRSHMERNMPDWLDPEAPMFPRMLQQAGYATAHFGKWHLTNTHVPDAPSPLEYGYDEFNCFNLSSQFRQMNADSTIFKAMDFIERHRNQSFFINVWIHATHTPHYPKEEFLEQYKHLDEQQIIYAAITSEADHRIGLLFNKLKELNLDKNTLVIFSSDNGPEITGDEKRKWLEDSSTGPGYGRFYSVGETGGLKGRKRSLYAGGVRTPFIVRWPGVVPAGKKDSITAIAAVDLLPTFLELAGIAPPQDYQTDGESLLDAFMGKEIKRQKAIYWQWKFALEPGPNWPAAGIQEANWKLLINEKAGIRELYDISTDWSESHNLIDQFPEKAKILERKIQEWEETLPDKANPDCFSGERAEIQ